MIVFNFTSHCVSSYSDASAIKTVSEQQSGEAPALTESQYQSHTPYGIIYIYIHINTEIKCRDKSL